ncbi:glycosyltransferase [Acetobacter sp. DmW_136]|uniref:glycosyltransferase family 2 protein n=1 Tax=Acetobacter sp. DmW_136 TaxID=2591091 RepID=UPI00187820C8
MLTVLHRLILPTEGLEQCDAMYARPALPERVADTSSSAFRLKMGQAFTFDTFYNAFSVKKWKQAGGVSRLLLSLHIRGQGEVTLFHRSKADVVTPLWSKEIEGEIRCAEEISAWPTLSEGLLYCSVTAQSECTVEAVYFATSSPMVQAPQLGVVITHFNRQQYVRNSIQRVQKALLQDPAYQDVIHFIVIDNSANLDPAEVPGAKVIKNHNYGGSGGFARGLLYLHEQGTFTHCLFMDDDISCEVEAIRRCYAMLAYSVDRRIGLAGTLLDDQKPWSVQEKGAEFSAGVFRPLHKGEDVRPIENLLNLEQDTGKPVYGGWWFFAFRLDAVSAYPFPFFVRGDDALFGLMNRFNIVTVNGIACFSEHFLSKESAFTRYLGMRASLAIYLMVGQGRALPAVKMMGLAFLWCALSCRYQSAQAILLAFQDVSQGADFWRQNLDFMPLAKRIQKEAVQCKEPAYFQSHPFHYEGQLETKLRRCVRLMSLNGHLLPGWALYKKPVYVGEYTSGLLGLTFRHQRIVYRKYESSDIFEVELNRFRLLALTWAFFKTSIIFILKTPFLRKSYRSKLSTLCSRNFWISVYK